jgi:hypothetical protein
MVAVRGVNERAAEQERPDAGQPHRRDLGHDPACDERPPAEVGREDLVAVPLLLGAGVRCRQRDGGGGDCERVAQTHGPP